MTSILKAPFRLYRYAVIESLQIVKRHGFRELFRQRGWRVVAIIVAYYLVRDTFLYLLIPFFIARGFF